MSDLAPFVIAVTRDVDVSNKMAELERTKQQLADSREIKLIGQNDVVLFQSTVERASEFPGSEGKNVILLTRDAKRIPLVDLRDLRLILGGVQVGHAIQLQHVQNYRSIYSDGYGTIFCSTGVAILTFSVGPFKSQTDFENLRLRNQTWTSDAFFFSESDGALRLRHTSLDDLQVNCSGMMFSRIKPSCSDDKATFGADGDKSFSKQLKCLTGAQGNITSILNRVSSAMRDLVLADLRTETEKLRTDVKSSRRIKMLLSSPNSEEQEFNDLDVFSGSVIVKSTGDTMLQVALSPPKQITFTSSPDLQAKIYLGDVLIDDFEVDELCRVEGENEDVPEPDDDGWIPLRLEPLLAIDMKLLVKLRPTARQESTNIRGISNDERVRYHTFLQENNLSEGNNSNFELKITHLVMPLDKVKHYLKSTAENSHSKDTGNNSIPAKKRKFDQEDLPGNT